MNTSVQPVLETVLDSRRLTMTPITSDHAFALYAGLQSTALYAFIPDEPPTSLGTLAERFRRLESRQSPDGQEWWLNWALRLKDSGTWIGHIEANVILANGEASIAYIVFADHWRQGYAKEACQRLLGWLFDALGVLRVTAEMDTANVASYQLVESLGFARVATTLAADTFKGRVSDEYRYELTRERWSLERHK